jgi:hypothetical protein
MVIRRQVVGVLQKQVLKASNSLLGVAEAEVFECQRVVVEGVGRVSLCEGE